MEKSKKPKCNKSVQPDWSELNPDLLDLIASKLVAFVHVLAFKDVCSSWRMAALRRTKKTSSSIIAFFAASNKVALPCDNVQFLSINQKKPCKLLKTQWYVQHNIRDQDLIGSHPQGWVVMMDKLTRIYLVQLFSCTRIQLPNPNISSYDDKRIVKAILSTHNSTHLVVVQVHAKTRYNNVGIWRTGDGEWTWLPGSDYIDIACCDNKPYALRKHHNNSVLVDFLDLGINSASTGKNLSITVPNFTYSDNLFVKLVSSSEGEIVIVNCRGKECRIWEVNLSEGLCEQVNSLNGNTLIIGDVTSAFVMANEVEDQGYKRNSVYVVREEISRQSYLIRRRIRSDVTLRVYELEAGKVEQLWKSKRDQVWHCTRRQVYKPEPHLFGLIHGFC